jgi:shikimate dehydrogenase
VTERARRLAVLGSPIAHSRSPAIHNAAYAALGLPWTYEAIDVSVDELSGFLDGLGDPWHGLSLTMPLKHEVIRSLDRCDELVRTVGAANTVLINNGQLVGFNTDVYGAERMLADAVPTTVARALVLGAGATARSVIAALSRRGTREAVVWTRTPARARDLVLLANRCGIDANVTTATDGFGLPDIVVSTLPGTADLNSLFPKDLRSTVPLVDVAYDPWPTSLAQHWLDGGGSVVNSGLEMLIYQALAQVRIFVGGDPALELASEPEVLEAMRSAVLGTA